MNKKIEDKLWMVAILTICAITSLYLGQAKQVYDHPQLQYMSPE